VPEWSNLVKTSKHKELAPVDADWYYIRCAAVLRRIYIRGKIGTTGIAKRYGGMYLCYHNVILLMLFLRQTIDLLGSILL